MPDNPSPSPPPTAPDVGRMRVLLGDLQKGEAARAEIARHLDPRGIYSEDMEPRPVWMVVDGELKQYQPTSLYKLADTPSPPPPNPMSRRA